MKTMRCKPHRRFLPARLVLCVILVLTASAGLSQPAQAAGLYTHTWFVERAIERLETYGGYSELVGILNQYPEIVNYGAIFPDITFGNIDPDWAEAMHDTGEVNNNYAEYLQFLVDHGYDKWNSDLQTGYYKDFLEDPHYTAVIPKFRANLMGQILQTFRNSPRSAEDDMVIAFLFGLIAHQEADASWHWTDPNWLGLERYAFDNKYSTCGFGVPFEALNHPETCLDVVLRNHDTPDNPIETSYLSTIEKTVLASAITAGIPSPECKGRLLPWFCILPEADPLFEGQEQIEYLWVVQALNTFFDPGWLNFVQNYVPGGIEYGSAFVAGAWMQAWDNMSYTGRYYAKPIVSGRGDCHGWDDACLLPYALGHSIPGQEIWVAAGIYKPTQDTSDRDASFLLRSDVAVYGGFAGTENARYQRDPATNVTILSGDIDNNDVDTDGDNIVETAGDIRGNNSYHVVTGANGATLDGFVVTAGNANELSTCPHNNCSGGGMQNLKSGALIMNVTFSGNAAGLGGGMYNWGTPSPRIKNVTFIGNTAIVGGGMYTWKSQPSIANVTFSNNSAEYWGGGMFFNSFDMVIGHATFYGNSAGISGGGVFVDVDGYVELRNSILWGNTSPEGAQIYPSSALPFIAHSILQGGCPKGSVCEDVSVEDPLLGAIGNYGGSTPTIPLLPGSSAIDTASDDFCFASTDMSGAGGLDQRGVIRPQGLNCDIGAYEVDTTAPSLTSFTRHDPATSPTNVDQLIFRATFSDNVHNVDATDFIVSGTTATITDITAVNNSVYEITVSGGDLPDLDGTVGLDLADGQDIADLAENALLPDEPSINETYLVSNAELYLVSFTRQSPAANPTNADVLVFRATFSAVAQYVDVTAFSVTGTTASVTLITPVNPSTYDITVAGGDLAGLNGTVGLDLSERSEICDLNINLMPIIEPEIDETYEVDNTAPSLISFTRQEPPASPTNASTLVFRATFNEDVQNVDVADFTVSGTTATVSDVSPVSANVYDLTVTGGDLATYNGIVNLSLAVEQDIQDLAGNALPTEEPDDNESYTVDHIAPTLNSFRRWQPPNNPTNEDTLIFEANFSEAVMNIDAADFTVTGTTAAVINVELVSPGRYRLTVSGGDLAGLTGTVGLDLAPGQDVKDLAGNPLPTGEPPIDEAFRMDNTAPALSSITRLNPASSPTNADVLIFRATFSESVQNVDTSDFVVTGSTATITSITGSFMDTTFDLTVSGGDLAGLNGTVGLDLAAGQNIEDLVMNPLLAGEPDTDETYLVDNTAPTGTSILRQMPLNSPTNATSVTFRVTFGEDVQNVVLTDFGLTVTGTVTGSISAVNSISASTYDVVVTGVGGDGILDLNFSPTNGITDLAGNPLGANPIIESEQIYTIDNTFPTVLYDANTIPAQNSVLYIGPTQIVIEFSEDVLHDGSGEAANSPTNYLLVEAGKNNKIDTLSCAGGRVFDDRLVTINRVSYSNNGGTGPFVATLDVNNGAPLPLGNYRLYICGTISIHDLAGNILNGGTSDAPLNFAVIKVLLPNTGFAPNRVTRLPDQPTEKTYADLGDLWLEIPRLGVQIPIVGVPLSASGYWDVSWLGRDAGWLNGSAFPTYPGNSVLTAHVYDSYGNPGPFVQLNQLWYGDKVIVHAQGMQYVYEAREVLQVGPGSTSAILKHMQQSWVTLVTCRGYDAAADSYAYRVLVRAVLTDVYQLNE